MESVRTLAGSEEDRFPKIRKNNTRKEKGGGVRVNRAQKKRKSREGSGKETVSAGRRRDAKGIYSIPS